MPSSLSAAPRRPTPAACGSPGRWSRPATDVEIAAVAADGLPERESGDGWELRRYRPSGPWARLAALAAASPATGPARVGAAGRPAPARSAARPASAGALRRWVFWPHTVRGWWATLASRARTRRPVPRLWQPDGRRRPAGPAAIAPWAGGPPEPWSSTTRSTMSSSRTTCSTCPRPLRTWHARRESRWAHAADAVITVNEALAERLADALAAQPGAAGRAQLSGGAAAGGPPRDPIRAELGLPAATRIVLFQGRLGPRLGLDAAAEAVLAVPTPPSSCSASAAGFEREERPRPRTRFAGRHFTLPARHPDELLAWTAGADVALVPLPPVSVNQRLSSPNKFWEALAAGTPVVVPAGLSYMAGLVRASATSVSWRHRHGPADLAAGITACLERSSPRIRLARRESGQRPPGTTAGPWPRRPIAPSSIGWHDRGRCPPRAARRIVMYVFNDATLDSRVRREAATLAAAGYSVTLLATAIDPAAASVDPRVRRRLRDRPRPGPPRLAGFMPLVVSPWSLRRRSVGRITTALRHGPREWPRIPAAARPRARRAGPFCGGRGCTWRSLRPPGRSGGSAEWPPRASPGC